MPTACGRSLCGQGASLPEASLPHAQYWWRLLIQPGSWEAGNPLGREGSLLPCTLCPPKPHCSSSAPSLEAKNNLSGG